MYVHVAYQAIIPAVERKSVQKLIGKWRIRRVVAVCIRSLKLLALLHGKARGDVFIHYQHPGSSDKNTRCYFFYLFLSTYQFTQEQLLWLAMFSMQDNYSLQEWSLCHGYKARANIIKRQHPTIPHCSTNVCANHRLCGSVYNNAAGSPVCAGLQHHR